MLGSASVFYLLRFAVDKVIHKAFGSRSHIFAHDYSRTSLQKHVVSMCHALLASQGVLRMRKDLFQILNSRTKAKEEGVETLYDPTMQIVPAAGFYFPMVSSPIRFVWICFEIDSRPL